MFCAMIRTEYGLCCPNPNYCKRWEVNFCSYEAPRASKALKLFACPHTPTFCGREELFEAKPGKLSTIKPSGMYKFWLKGGALCRYKIIFPKEARQFDKIAVHVKNLENIKLYTVDTKRYSDDIFTENILSLGQV